MSFFVKQLKKNMEGKLDFLLHLSRFLDIISIRKKKEDVRMSLEITKDTIIGDILDNDGTTAEYFLEMGMHCLGCPASRGETIEQACMVHGVDVEELLQKLRNHGK